MLPSRQGQGGRVEGCVGLDHEHAARRGGLSKRFHEGDHVPRPRLEKLPRWRDEDHPGGIAGQGGHPLRPEEHVARLHLHSILHAERPGRFPQEVGRGEMPLAEDRPRRAAADRLEPDRPGAGEAIDRDGSGDASSDQIEERLADAVFHRPRPRVGAEFEPPPAEAAADDPRGACGLGLAGIGAGWLGHRELRALRGNW